MVDRLKIDLVITELETGGAERCCYELAKFLRSSGHDARIISFGPLAKPPIDGILQKALSAGVPVLSLNTAKAYQFPLAWHRLRKLVREQRPDIAQSFMWHANVLSAAVYPAFNVPLVGGNRVLDPNYVRHRSGAWAASRMKRIVAVSSEVASWTAEFEKAPECKIETIPNGIDLAAWDRSTLEPAPGTSEQLIQLSSHPPYLLFVGRLHHQKGIDVLESRIERILESLPDHHLVLLGDGPFREKLQASVSRMSCAPRIHWLGVRDDVGYWMRRSQLLVLPTRYEGMPNVILEAMASSIAVATMRVEGVAELLQDGASEQSVDRDDWEAWEQLVVRLASTPDVSNRLAIENRKRVESSFQLVDQLQKYVTLYRRVLSGVD